MMLSVGRIGGAGRRDLRCSAQAGFASTLFSREEPRSHVHAQSADGEAEFGLDPAIESAVSCDLKEKDRTRVRRLMGEHKDDFRAAWNKHFRR